MHNLVGIRPYHGYLLQLGSIERQQVLAVLQQDNRLCRHLARQVLRFLAFVRRHFIGVCTDVAVRVGRVLAVQQAELQCHKQVAPDSLIDVSLGQVTLLQRFLDVGQIFIQELPGSGLHHRSRTFRHSGISLVRADQQAQGAAIRTDDAVVAPLVAGNLFQAGMHTHGGTVPTVVGCHESTAAALGNALVEWISIVFVEQAHVEVARRAVTPVFVAVGQEVFHQGRCTPVARVVALQALDIGYRQPCRQESIFPETFFRAPPARVACQVGIRGTHHQGCTLVVGTLHVIPCLDRCLLAYFAQQVGVPCGTQPVRLRENSSREIGCHPLTVHHLMAAPTGGSAQSQPMQAFVMAARQNAQAGHSQVAAQKGDFFIQRKLLHQGVDTLFIRQLRVLKLIGFLRAGRQASHRKTRYGK